MDEEAEYIAYLKSMLKDPEISFEKKTSLSHDKDHAQHIYKMIANLDEKYFPDVIEFRREFLKYSKEFSQWKMNNYPKSEDYKHLIDQFIINRTRPAFYREKLETLQNRRLNQVEKDNISHDILHSTTIITKIQEKLKDKNVSVKGEDPILEKAYKFSLWKMDMYPEREDYEKLIDEYFFLDSSIVIYKKNLDEIMKKFVKNSKEERSIADDIRHIELIINNIYQYVGHKETPENRTEFINLLIKFSLWKMKTDWEKDLMFNLKLVSYNKSDKEIEEDKYHTLISMYMKIDKNFRLENDQLIETPHERSSFLENIHPLNFLIDTIGSFIPHIQ